MTVRIVHAFLLLVALLSPLPGRLLHDFANVLPSNISADLESQLQKIEQETTAEVAVVTVQSLEGKDIDAYALELFNEWKLGKADVNNGILFLIAPNEHRARIEVGFGLEPLITDGLAGEILDTEVIPRFKSNQYALGIRAGTETLISILRENPEAARGVPGSAPAYVMTPYRTVLYLGFAGIGFAILTIVLGKLVTRTRQYSPLVLYCVLAVTLGTVTLLIFFGSKLAFRAIPYGVSLGSVGGSIVAVFYNLRRFRGYGPHYCGACKTQLNVLSETEDDAKLSKEARLEESLNSVDYDVWVCPACLKEHTEEYRAFMSGFSECAKCRRRTFAEKTKTVVTATRHSTGLQKIEGECRNCWQKSSRTKTIPMITSSSSSGGNSSSGGGGGSSGGGGASRGW